jgi:hypothetical protein
MPIQQIDYSTIRTLVSYNGKRTVRIAPTRETRYHFSGVLISGETDDHYKLNEERTDWNKSAFPLPWTGSPDVVDPDTAKPEDTPPTKA